LSAWLNSVARELQLDVESVPIAEFIPLPPDAASRSRFIADYGNLEVHLFDLYTIALSKIARGFETDFEDILFMLQQSLIDLPKLERHYQAVLPDVSQADIDPQEFKQNFDWVKQRFRN
jgi:hypothetical protein